MTFRGYHRPSQMVEFDLRMMLELNPSPPSSQIPPYANAMIYNDSKKSLHRRIQGRGNPAMVRSLNGTWPPAVKDFYHTKMAHILVSVYSVFLEPRSTSKSITINNIHIIDLVWLFPCTFSVYDLLHAIWSLTPFPLNCLNKSKRLKVEH